MPTIRLHLSDVHTSADVIRFVEIAEAIGITGARAYPLLHSPDGPEGIDMAVSVDLNQIRLPHDERD